jgi:glycosyltransferase involved in cell wall biosynthesis
VPSLMEDEKEGLLFPDGDPYALAGRLRRMLDCSPAAEEMGRRARQRALRRHEPEAIVENLLGIYAEVMSKRLSAWGVRRSVPQRQGQ